MLHKISNYIAIFILFLFLTSCHGEGFYQPATLNLDLPNGSPEFRAGWSAGCRSAMSTKVFQNSFVYNQDFGNGIYQHDSAFARAWARGWFACVMHIGNFVNAHAFRYGPLQ